MARVELATLQKAGIARADVRLWVRFKARFFIDAADETQLAAYDRGMTDAGKLSSEGRLAIELFKEQLDAVPTMRNFRGITPEFSRWKDLTAGLFIKYLPDSSCYNRFCIIQFGSAHAAQERYLRGCDLAEQCIRSAIQDIERFDVKPAGHR